MKGPRQEVPRPKWKVEERDGAQGASLSVIIEKSRINLNVEVFYLFYHRFLWTDVIEVYHVARRLSLSIDSFNKCDEQIGNLLKEINLIWNNLTAFIAGTSIMVRIDGP